MKVRISHGVAKTKADKGTHIMIWDMNPKPLGIKTGQVFYLDNTDPKTGERCHSSVRIKTLYPYHALCVVNEAFFECFTYNELYMIGSWK